ncbi:hypothetical protein [Streptomyces mirabilis]|uniref:hypothetical protein n=1 Tax=Streptomyces mirabilis TaxID=68239 RepID=UPI00368096ED
MSETRWVDPQYAELVEAFDELVARRRRQGPVTRCRSCTHGLGAIVMVDLTTKKPIVTPCTGCRTGA